MELKTLSVAIAATLSSTAAFAMSEPVAQVTEKVEHHQHEHGVETAQPEYAPTELLPQLPKQTLRTRATQSVEAASVVCDVESFTTTNSNDLISA
ncbi:collagenase, partial [Vibrio sp. 1249-1]|nr:collagenase [Vibrio sp. 1249-1]